MRKNVILTGIGGFIGSHCLEYFLEKTDWYIIGIDSFRHKGTYRRLNEVLENKEWKDRVEIHHHDLAAPIDDQFRNLIQKTTVCSLTGMRHHRYIDIIINMASDSAVERSTQNPVACLRNNYDLTINMLEFAREVKPGIFIQISTDEVYGEAKPGEAHKEWDVILPSNPYAASKAAQEAVAISYWRTYDVPVVLTNTMNIIAERQDPEKFLPKIIQKISIGQEMPIYAEPDGKIGSRFYLDARNKADALIFLTNFRPVMYKDGAERPDRYNICGDVEMNNLEMAQLVAKVAKQHLNYKLVPSQSARKGYDRRYALDGTKLKELGWTAPISFEETVARIVKWTLENKHWAV